MATIRTIFGKSNPLEGVLATGVPLAFAQKLGSGGIFGTCCLSPILPNCLAISEAGRMRARKLDLPTGLITTLIGSGNPGWTGDGQTALNAAFSNPQNIFQHPVTGDIYIADTDNYVIRKIDAITGLVSTVAGNGVRGFGGDGGPALLALLDKPRGCNIDLVGDMLIADTDNLRIRKVNLVSAPIGQINTICGGGVSTAEGVLGTLARLEYVHNVVVHPVSGDIYWGNWGSSAPGADYKVRRFAVATGLVWTVAGTGVNGYLGDGGLATLARISQPIGVGIDPAGANLYIADSDNDVIRVVNFGTGIINTVAGTGVAGFSGDGGPAILARLNVPGNCASNATHLFISDRNNNRIRRVNLGTGIIDTIAGNGTPTIYPWTPDQSTAYNMYSTMYNRSNPNLLYAASPNQSQAYKIDLTANTVTLFAGTGVAGFSGDGGLATLAQMNLCYELCVGPITGRVYIPDFNNKRIRVVDPGTGIITTYAGNGGNYSGDGGLATAAGLNNVIACCCDAAENLYISAYGDQRIRRVAFATGIITTFAGTGGTGATGDGGLATAATMNRPYQPFIDPAGANLYFADRVNHRIRKINFATGIITRVAGTTEGFSGDGGLATLAQLNDPRGCAVDDDYLWISDTDNSRIRRVDLVTGIITTYAGNGGKTPFVENGDPTGSATFYPVGMDIPPGGNGLLYTDWLYGRARLISFVQRRNSCLIVG